MIVVNSIPVAVVLNGQFVPVSDRARLVAGKLAAPMSVVERFSDSGAVDTAGKTITITRGSHVVRMRIGSFDATIDGVRAHVPLAPFIDGSATFVPLAPVVADFGGRLEYDGRAHVVSITIDATPAPIVSMAPFNPSAPTVAPATPGPVYVTPEPNPSSSAVPLPRRTGIDVIPSRP